MEKEKIKKHKYQKIVTRDLPLILVEGFIYSMNNIYKDLTGKEPDIPSMVIYSKNYILEEWMDEEFEKELIELIYKRNSKDKKFFDKYIDYYKKHLEKYSKKDSISELDKFKEYIESLHKALEGFVVFYFTAGYEKTDKNILQEAKKIRDDDTLGDDSDKLIRSSLMKIFPSAKDYETVISKNELGNIPQKEILEKRGEGFIFAPPVFIGNSSLKNFEKNNPNYDFVLVELKKDVSEFKGEIACNGKIKGKIRVLVRKKDIYKLKEGEILVSPMTTPDFVPAMKKAGAIVTDEGGITSHAAIVSRELKKPCIIGTKIASRVLKDGDLIEVDADEGVVKIIKKA